MRRFGSTWVITGIGALGRATDLADARALTFAASCHSLIYT